MALAASPEAKGVLFEVGDFKPRHPGAQKSVDEGGDRSIALAGQFQLQAVPTERGPHWKTPSTPSA